MVSASLLALTACQRSPQDQLYQAQEEMLSQIKVDGFSRVQMGTVDNAAQGIYVGTPVDDVRSRISGGQVSLGPAQAGTVSKAQQALYAGKGKAPNGRECSVYVDRLRAGEPPFENWGLSKRQAEDVTAGKQQVLIINATCGNG
ncbi:hypothetical protein GCM10020218_002760 [Dactylosporangium vinaceum]